MPCVVYLVFLPCVLYETIFSSKIAFRGGGGGGGAPTLVGPVCAHFRTTVVRVSGTGGPGGAGWGPVGVGGRHLERQGGYRSGKSTALSRLRMVSRSVEVSVVSKRFI